MPEFEVRAFQVSIGQADSRDPVFKIQLYGDGLGQGPKSELVFDDKISPDANVANYRAALGLLDMAKAHGVKIRFDRTKGLSSLSQSPPIQLP
ncbi:MAG: hypothetical protein ACI97A_003744 [Planctomycetota bacterium]|jgi:hypothetical protein